MSDGVEQRAIRQGRDAWKRITKDSAWNEWVTVGQALEIGRIEAMRQARTNQPSGSSYNKAFSAWLDANGFGKMDKGTRSHLSSCMRQRAEIETWRATLTLSERLHLNNPRSVIRKFGERAKDASKAPKPKSNTKDAEIMRLQKENDDARAKIAELMNDRRFSKNLSAKDIASILHGCLPKIKFDEVVTIGRGLYASESVRVRTRPKPRP